LPYTDKKTDEIRTAEGALHVVQILLITLHMYLVADLCYNRSYTG